MSSIDELLQEFTRETADRCWIATVLADSSDDRVVALLIDLLLSAEEDDLLRITVLKHLVLREDSDQLHQRFGSAVIRVLQRDTDDLVRQHAASALGGYVNVEGVLDTLESFVRNESQDIDVRYNCLGAIQSNWRLSKCREALQRLVDVRELGKSAQQTLDTQ